MCPNHADMESLMVMGDSASNTTNKWQFYISKCVKENLEGVDCKSSDEIDKFISDITVEHWAL